MWSNEEKPTTDGAKFYHVLIFEKFFQWSPTGKARGTYFDPPTPRLRWVSADGALATSSVAFPSAIHPRAKPVDEWRRRIKKPRRSSRGFGCEQF